MVWPSGCLSHEYHKSIHDGITPAVLRTLHHTKRTASSVKIRNTEHLINKSMDPVPSRLKSVLTS
jgi:hypothetical protein